MRFPRRRGILHTQNLVVFVATFDKLIRKMESVKRLSELVFMLSRKSPHDLTSAFLADSSAAAAAAAAAEAFLPQAWKLDRANAVPPDTGTGSAASGASHWSHLKWYLCFSERVT